MAPVGLKHWMLHNDQLANEYDETLKLSPGYDPVRAVDPALTFHAPLLTGPDSIPGAIRATVERNSQGTYRAPRGTFLLAAGDDESRHEYTRDDEPLGVLMEPASTNKCENYNANPDPALTGLAKGGDASATLTRVQDIVGLEAAGLQNICTSGYVVRLNNTAGSSNAWVSISGGAQNTNTHQGSVYWKGTGNAFLAMITPNPSQALTANYQRFVQSLTPPGAGAILQIAAQPGADVYFILNQLEEKIVPSSVIVTRGGATSRAVDQLSWPLAGAPYGQQLLADDAAQSGLLTSGTLPWFSTFDRNGWTIDHGILEGRDIGQLDTARQDCDLQTGKFYQFDFEILETNGAQLSVYIGTYIENFTGVDPGIYSIVAKADADYVQFENTNWIGKVRALNVREAAPIINQAQGMSAIIVRLGFGFDDALQNSQHGILSLRNGVVSLIYLNRSATTSAFVAQTRSSGGNLASASIPGNFQKDDLFVVAVRWNLADNLQVSCKRLGQWYVGGGAFNTEWELENKLIAARLPSFPIHVQHIHFWMVDRGQDWLQEFFEGVAE